MCQDHKGLNPNGSQSINQRDELPTALMLKIKHWDVMHLQLVLLLPQLWRSLLTPSSGQSKKCALYHNISTINVSGL